MNKLLNLRDKISRNNASEQIIAKVEERMAHIEATIEQMGVNMELMEEIVVQMLGAEGEDEHVRQPAP